MTARTRATRSAAVGSGTVRLLGAGVGALTLAFVLPGSAAAHVSLQADSTAAGAQAVLTLAVPHGCDGAPTTRIAVQIPAGLDSVTPTINPGWTVTKRSQKLAQPVTSRHNTVLTHRVAEVVWTARTPLAEGYRDTLSLQVPLPEGAAGRQLVFPTVQTCTTGETAWTQVAAPGQDAAALEHPAPSLTVTAAEAPGQHGGAPAADGEAVPPGAHTSLQAASVGGMGAAGTGGLVMGALGLVAGVTALVRTRPARTRPDQG